MEVENRRVIVCAVRWTLGFFPLSLSLFSSFCRIRLVYRFMKNIQLCGSIALSAETDNLAILACLLWCLGRRHSSDSRLDDHAGRRCQQLLDWRDKFVSEYHVHPMDRTILHNLWGEVTSWFQTQEAALFWSGRSSDSEDVSGLENRTVQQACWHSGERRRS